MAGEQPLLSGSSRHTQTGSGNGLLGQDDSELVVQINASIQAETEEPKKERLTLLGLTWVSIHVHDVPHNTIKLFEIKF